jgi:acetyl esterase/lipase
MNERDAGVVSRDPQGARVRLEQRQAVDALMRDAPLDIGGEVAEQRAIVEQMMASFGRADDVATSDTTLGGVRATLVETRATLADRVVLYLHGGAYALGSANGGAGLAAEVGRRTRARAYSLEYRLAPEYPYPAAIEDCIAAYRGLLDGGFDARQIALAGELAGAGMVAATLIRAKTARLTPAGVRSTDVP